MKKNVYVTCTFQIVLMTTWGRSDDLLSWTCSSIDLHVIVDFIIHVHTVNEAVFFVMLQAV